MKTVSILVGLLLVAVVVGCAPMSDGHLFEIATAAVKADAEFPMNASIGSMKDAEFHVGKNAACVLVPYTFNDTTGQPKSDTYTVWLKRICVRWELDRMFPTPKYPAAEAAAR